MSQSKKIVIVTFLPLPKYGSTIFITALSDNLCVAGQASFLLRYNMEIGIYLNSTSTASQHLIPNWSALLAIYCINLQQALVGNNCLFTVIFSPGL